jgi:sodium transport system permease protein
MNFKKIKIIYFKEMKDILRDRRTLISMLLVPILLFPILMFGMTSLSMMMAKKTGERVNPLVIIGRDEAPSIFSILKENKSFEIVQEKDYSAALKDKRITAALEFSKDFERKIGAGDSAQVKIYFDKAEIQSDMASDRLGNILKTFQDSVVTERLKDRNVDRSLLHPVRIKMENLASKEKMGGFFLSMFLPYMIMIMALTGAMYPAIDLTAGEKERGTLETLLVSPASRGEISSGKFLAVFTASLVTAIVSTVSMVISAGTSFAKFKEAGEVSKEAILSISPLSILVLFLLIIPYCCLASSILLSLSLFAKSYKEAQSYISPLLIIIIMPAMASFLPGLELSVGMAFIPIINISLALKQILLGTYNWGYIGLIFLSTVLYAALAIFITRMLFEKEQVLFRT